MWTWSAHSWEVYQTLDPKLQLVVDLMLERSVIDFRLLSGYRGEEEQNALVAKGASNLYYPNSDHNATNDEGKPSSKAVDILIIDKDPDPDWGDIEWFYYIGGLFLKICKELKINGYWGGHWKMRDLGHLGVK